MGCSIISKSNHKTRCPDSISDNFNSDIPKNNISAYISKSSSMTNFTKKLQKHKSRLMVIYEVPIEK